MTTQAENKKAHFNYTILESLEAGLVLSGAEVKSIKLGHLSIRESFVTFQGHDAFLTNTHITPYPHARLPADYDPTQPRKLLLHKKEIDYLRGKSQQKGLTIVPLKVYTKNQLIKVQIAVAQGKHTYNKKETLKKRDLEREHKRTLKTYS
jgi:SsrA-binding protein